MYIMIKRSISFALTYLVVRTFFDFVRGEGIDWVDNLAVSCIIFFLMWFVLWTEIPYKWNKNRDKH